MDENKLTHFDRAEYYRVRFKSRGTMIIIMSVLSFILGFFIAKFIYA